LGNECSLVSLNSFSIYYYNSFKR